MTQRWKYLFIALGLSFSLATAQETGATFNTPGKVPEAIAAAIKVELFTKAVPSPLFLTAAPGDSSGRLFILSKKGYIYIHKNGAVDKAKPFLDLSKQISWGYEQGLLGMTFHPGYQKNGLLYVHMTDKKGFTRVVEFAVSKDDPDLVDLSTERVILLLDGQAFPGHNAALPQFGPDGLMYIATGDGGFGNKPNTGQNPKDFYGKLLRIDPTQKTSTLEIVGYGLRNPWRFSFDRFDGDLYIADVGHNKYEELNFAPISQLSGYNFGWRTMEGHACFKGTACDKSKMTLPIFEYDRKTGCSITGGYVYRGKALPELSGAYFYADFCTGMVRSMKVNRKDNSITDHWMWKPVLDPDDQFASLVSFGEDNDGELYLISMDSSIYKFVRVTP
jgi:glucose/arabinose dehydrogenase